MKYLSTEILNNIPKGETHHDKINQLYYDEMKQDIVKNGLNLPIRLMYYVNDDALRIYDGHHRLKIANELGIKKIPIDISVIWDGSIESGNKDIAGQPLYHPPKQLDVSSYELRNYEPSNIEPEELGFYSLNENHIITIIKEEIQLFVN